MTPRRACWLACGIYVLGLLWAAALLWRVDRHLASRARASFFSEGGRLAAFAGRSLGAGWADRGPALRRLAAEPDSRYALLLDPRGEPLAAEGAQPDLHGLGRRPAAGVWELAGEVPSYAFVQPVWEEGRARGTLVWARWAGRLAEDRRRDRRSLLLAYVWWAFAAAAVFVWTRPWTRPRLGGK